MKVAYCGNKKKFYDPLVKWFSEEYKLPPVVLGDPHSIARPKQPPEILESMQWMLFHIDDLTLAALDSLTRNLRSLIIALAVWNRKITIQEGIVASYLEESHQQEKHGVVEGVHDVEIINMTIKSASASFVLHSVPNTSK